eukprot:scaffold7169_cov107-Cylindrotheca_fusiformis.AAC.7
MHHHRSNLTPTCLPMDNPGLRESVLRRSVGRRTHELIRVGESRSGVGICGARNFRCNCNALPSQIRPNEQMRGHEDDDIMICILIGICPPSPDLWEILTKRVHQTIRNDQDDDGGDDDGCQQECFTIQWISHSIVTDDGDGKSTPTQIVTAISDAPVDAVVAATTNGLGDTPYICELWASAPAILPLMPLGGYSKHIIYDPSIQHDLKNWEDWARPTLRKWGLFFQKSILNTTEVNELRSIVESEIESMEESLKAHRPEISIGKDTFHFREVASRGNERFDLRLLSSDAIDFVKKTIMMGRVSTVLESILHSISEKDVDFDLSVVYSKPGAPNQGWHCDGDHLKGSTDAGWDVDGWKTKLADPYALCLFIPLIDLNDTTGYTQFWPASHRNRDLMGFGPVAEITEATWDGKCTAGDAIWYDYRLFHRGIANTSNLLRPVVQIVFKKSWYVERANYGTIGVTEVERS